VIEDDIRDACGGPGHFVDGDGFARQPVLDAYRAEEPGARQLVEVAVARRQNGGTPAVRNERGREVPHDIAHTADFAAAQCRILCSQEYDVPVTDKDPA
jgi:hypothetical protein